MQNSIITAITFTLQANNSDSKSMKEVTSDCGVNWKAFGSTYGVGKPATC